MYKKLMTSWLKHLFPDRTFEVTQQTRYGLVFVKVHDWVPDRRAFQLGPGGEVCV